MTHTAGPWPLFDNSGLTLKRRVTVTIGDNRLDVTALEREDRIVIAAAPDMLAALEGALKNAEFMLERAPIFQPKYGQSKADIQAEIDYLRAVIAKAKGEGA